MDEQIKSRISQVFNLYYDQIEITPTEKEFRLYVSGFPEDLQNNIFQMGLSRAKQSFNFKRFYLELHDYPLDEFLKQQLSKSDYQFWKQKSLNL